MRRLRIGLKAIGLAVVVMTWAPSAAEEQASRYKNLKVLPQDISREEMGRVMLDNLRGLGLPRRAGEGCLFCHAGSMDVPRQEWDYASDEKPMKHKARVMMKMMREINETHFSQLASRSQPAVEVTCYTCHAARTNPMPLADLLVAEYDEGGVPALAQRYRSLRSRYYEGDAYDFRVTTLMHVANHLAANEQFEAAAAVHDLNIEHHDTVQARAGAIRTRMLQALEADGIEAMVRQYETLKGEHPASAFEASLLGPLAWGLQRGGKPEAAMRLFELGYAEHPDAYSSVENLAWGKQAAGDHEQALALANKWLAANPDHELGQRLVEELKQAQARQDD